MRTILLIISYDGSRFCGWQRQDGQRTVQEEIERVLEELHKQKTTLHGSGRTDSGVHAAGQAAHFISPVDSIPVSNYIPALNSRLPRDVRVMDARETPDGFHARFSATGRTYRYFIDCRNAPLAHELPYVWSIRRYPDLGRLNAMAAHLRGELDCSAFASAGDQSKSRMRYIEQAVFFMDGEKLVFEICANAFLWKMVRSLVGTLIFFEGKGLGSDEFAALIKSGDRSRAGPTAPGDGLFLWSVSFDGVRRGNAVLSEDGGQSCG